MVGVKKYEDAQIHSILAWRAKGHIPSEIVILCREQWPRKDFKESGIKYVIQNYGKDPSFVNNLATQQTRVSAVNRNDQFGLQGPQNGQFSNGLILNNNNSFERNSMFSTLYNVNGYSDFSGNTPHGSHGSGVQPDSTRINGFIENIEGNVSSLQGAHAHVNHTMPGSHDNSPMLAVSHNRMVSMSQSPQQGNWYISSPQSSHQQLEQNLRYALETNTVGAVGNTMYDSNDSTQRYGGQVAIQLSQSPSGAQIPQVGHNSGFYQFNDTRGSFNAGTSHGSDAGNIISVQSSDLPPADPLLDPILFGRQEKDRSSAAKNGSTTFSFAPSQGQAAQLPYQFQEPVVDNFKTSNSAVHPGLQNNDGNSMHQRPFQFAEPTTNKCAKTAKSVGKNRARTQVPLQVDQATPVVSLAAEPEQVYTGYPEFPFGRPKTPEIPSLLVAISPATEPEAVNGGRSEHLVGNENISQDPSLVAFSSGGGLPKSSSHTVLLETTQHQNTTRPDSNSASTQSIVGDGVMATQSSGRASEVASPSTDFFPNIIHFFGPVFEQPFIMPNAASGWSCREGRAEDVLIPIETPDQIPTLIMTSDSAIIELFNPVFKSGFFFADVLQTPQQAPQRAQPLYFASEHTNFPPLNCKSSIAEDVRVPETLSSKNIHKAAITTLTSSVSSATKDFDHLNLSAEQSLITNEISSSSKEELDAEISAGEEWDAEFARCINAYNQSADNFASSMQAQDLSDTSTSTSMEAVSNTINVATPSVVTPQLITTGTSTSPTSTGPPAGPVTKKRRSAEFEDSTAKRQATGTGQILSAVAAGKQPMIYEEEDPTDRFLRDILQFDAGN